MKIEQAITAQCRPEDVWQAFTDTTRWREWNSMLAGVQWLSGEPWQLGSELLLELNQPSFKLKSKIKEVLAPQRIQWTGSVMGANFENTFEFTAQPDATTMMKAAIVLSGPAVFFINDDMKKKGMAAFVPWFDALRTQAEKLMQHGSEQA